MRYRELLILWYRFGLLLDIIGKVGCGGLDYQYLKKILIQPLSSSSKVYFNAIYPLNQLNFHNKNNYKLL